MSRWNSRLRMQRKSKGRETALAVDGREASECSFASHVHDVGHCRHFVVVAAVAAAVGQHAVVLEFKVNAGAEFADLLVGAIYGLSNRDVACLHQVAIDGDGAEQILVMGTGIALLADDGNHAV